MAQIEYRFKDTSKGREVRASITLKCGYKTSETYREKGATDGELKRGVEGIIKTKVGGHLRWCKKDH